MMTSVHNFSHIYIEEQAEDRPETAIILERIRRSGQNPRIIRIGHYKDVFNRPRQNFIAQKHNPALILAIGREGLLHKGSERINSWGEASLYYNSLVRNCVYNCDYCFLQGMHDSAHTLMFVNNTDFMQAARKQALQGPMYLSISYLSEILAFEPLYPYCAEWMELAADLPALGLEIRTKSDYYQAVSHLKPVDNVFLVWSLSPEAVSRNHERGCASFRNRLFAARQAMKDGWPVKLTFDPVITMGDWKTLYREMIEEIFRRLDPAGIRELSYGVFRMNPDFLHRVRKLRPETPLLHQDYRLDGELGVMSSTREQIQEVRNFMEDELSRYLPDRLIHFVHG